MAKTLAEILAGEDMEGGELFCDDVYNNLKNHWYGAAAPGSPVNGMIWHKNDGTVSFYFGAAWHEFYNEYTTVTHKWLKGADKASAAALDISALDGNYFDVTGVAAITSITTSGRVGTVIRLHFDGILTLTHHAVDLILPGAANITTAAGDEATFIEYAAGDWRCVCYTKADGTAVVSAEGVGGANLLPNALFGVWSFSGLLSKTTGAQADYEIGAAIYNEDAEGVDDSGNWAKTDCTMALTNDPGGGAGGSNNYYTITETGATQRISQALAGLTVGRLYKFSVFIKNGTGTWAGAFLKILDNALAVTIGSVTLATAVGWTEYSIIFVATEATNQMVLDLVLGGVETAKIDDMRVIEVGPGCFAADDEGPDWWTKTSTLDLHRIQSDATYFKGLYGLKTTKGADGAEYLNGFGRIYDKEAHYMRYRGRTVTLGCWVYSVAAADNVKLQINDTDGTEESAFVAANTLTWVEITRACGAAITSFTPRILFDGDTADVAYISRPMLIFGSSIGEGNYQPRQEEWVLFETSANLKSNILDDSWFSTTAWTPFNVEADSNGVVPKGATAIQIRARCLDSDSAIGGAAELQLTGNVIKEMMAVASGFPDNTLVYAVGSLGVRPDGEISYKCQATGVLTFAPSFIYMGVRVN